MVHDALQALTWAPALALMPAGQSLLCFPVCGPCCERWGLAEKMLLLGLFFPAVSFEVPKRQLWHCLAHWRGACRHPPPPPSLVFPHEGKNHKKQGGWEMPLPRGAPLVPGRRWVRAWMSHRNAQCSIATSSSTYSPGLYLNPPIILASAKSCRRSEFTAADLQECLWPLIAPDLYPSK